MSSSFYGQYVRTANEINKREEEAAWRKKRNAILFIFVVGLFGFIPGIPLFFSNSFAGYFILIAAFFAHIYSCLYVLDNNKYEMIAVAKVAIWNALVSFVIAECFAYHLNGCPDSGGFNNPPSLWPSISSIKLGLN